MFSQKPGHRLVDGVVHDLEHEVMETARRRVADVHARTLAHGFQAFENLDVVGGVVPVGLHRVLRLRHASPRRSVSYLRASRFHQAESSNSPVASPAKESRRVVRSEAKRHQGYVGQCGRSTDSRRSRWNWSVPAEGRRSRHADDQYATDQPTGSGLAPPRRIRRAVPRFAHPARQARRRHAQLPKRRRNEVSDGGRRLDSACGCDPGSALHSCVYSSAIGMTT